MAAILLTTAGGVAVCAPGENAAGATPEIVSVTYDSEVSNVITIEMANIAAGKVIEDVSIGNSESEYVWFAHEPPLERSGTTVFIKLTVKEDSPLYKYWHGGKYTVDVDTYTKSFNVYEIHLHGGTEDYEEKTIMVAEDNLPYKLPSNVSWCKSPDGKGKRLTQVEESDFLYYGIDLYACGGTGEYTITIVPSLLVIRSGTSGTLTATFDPEDCECDVTWTSSDSSIITVSETGNPATVTAVGGQDGDWVTITASTEDGVTATAKVYVGIPVEGVELDKTSAEIGVYQEFTLNAKITPEDATVKDVIWTSSDDKVATVIGSGLNVTVLGIGIGAATITVTTLDGGFTATCSVNVIDNILPYDVPDGDLSPEQEKQIIEDLEKFREEHPDVVPVVNPKSGTEFFGCTTDFLKRATDEELDATFRFDFANKSSILMTAASVRSMSLPDESTFRIVSEKNETEEKGMMALFDVHVEINGSLNPMEFDPEITIFIPYKLADGQELDKLKVICVETGEELEYEYVDDTDREGVLFQTGHLSHYAVTYDAPEPQPSSDGMPLWAIILIIVIVIVIIAAIVLYILHKKGKI